jgi:hypothetical protein
MLIDQLQREHEAVNSAAADKSALNPLHHAALDPHPLADHEVVEWLNAPAAEPGAKKLDLSVGLCAWTLRAALLAFAFR